MRDNLHGDGESSNGRTRPFEGRYPGSNPGSPSAERPDEMGTYLPMPSRSFGFPQDIPVQDLHWLAGLLEGEGSFQAGPPSAPRYPIVALQMTDEDVVTRVATMFGRKVGCWQSGKARERPVFLMRITGSKAVAWMTALQPLMGERRRMQIDRAVASYEPRRSRCSTTQPRDARSACSPRATPYERSPNSSARASGASTTYAVAEPTSTSLARDRACLVLWFSDASLDRCDHGRRPGHADALQAAEGAARPLRAPARRLADRRRAGGGRGPRVVVDSAAKTSRASYRRA